MFSEETNGSQKKQFRQCHCYILYLESLDKMVTDIVRVAELLESKTTILNNTR